MPRNCPRASIYAAPLLISLCLAAAPQIAHAQTLRLLHDFQADFYGTNPSMRMAQTPDGAIYGTTTAGGRNFAGTIFKIAPDGSSHTIYDFETSRSGGGPSGALVLGPDNAVYGTTKYGGAHGVGVVFRIGAHDVVTTIYSFGSFLNDAYQPLAGLTYNPIDHLLYGTSSHGGANNTGAIFKISTTGVETLLRSFAPADASVATLSEAPLVFNPANRLFYGTTVASGQVGQDAVYTVSPTGDFHFIKVFTSDLGQSPQGGLTLASDGALYGTTAAGGAYGKGTIYKIASGAFSRVYSFPGGPIGAAPLTQLVSAKDGALYGTASVEGAGGHGSIYRLSPGAAPTVARVYGFTGAKDGGNPEALFQAANGLFYGAGAEDLGRVFKVSAGGTCIPIVDFHPRTLDGQWPAGALLLAADGNFYGTTFLGGNNNTGAIFRLTPQGDEEVLYSFDKNSLIGGYPSAALVQGPDGVLYGTAQAGSGPNGAGSVFRCVLNGNDPPSVSAVYVFNGAYGFGPVGALIFGQDGKLYGTTMSGSLNNNGVIFQLSTGGSLKLLRGFASESIGKHPECTLVQGPDGTLYGTTTDGGANGLGTVFALTTAGAFQWNKSLTTSLGSHPYEGLVFGADGDLYGTAQTGGLYDHGSIYKVAPSGNISLVYSFDGTQGNNPYGRLALGSDGVLYGSTYSGGASAGGNLFKLKNGVVTFLVNMNSALGENISASLTPGADGDFYGVAFQGGKNSGGTAFVLDVNLPVIQVFAPTSAQIGATITIGGLRLSTTSHVTINGVEATFTRVSDTRITAIVPGGTAPTGKITVTTAGGTVTSAGTFTNTSAPPPPGL